MTTLTSEALKQFIFDIFTFQQLRIRSLDYWRYMLIKRSIVAVFQSGQSDEVLQIYTLLNKERRVPKP